LRNLRNGNGETATTERQQNGGNQALDVKILCMWFIILCRLRMKWRSRVQREHWSRWSTN